MQLAPLTSDDWKNKLTQLTAQGTGVRIKERGGREKTVGDVKLLNDTFRKHDITRPLLHFMCSVQF